ELWAPTVPAGAQVLATPPPKEAASQELTSPASPGHPPATDISSPFRADAPVFVPKQSSAEPPSPAHPRPEAASRVGSLGCPQLLSSALGYGMPATTPTVSMFGDFAQNVVPDSLRRAAGRRRFTYRSTYPRNLSASPHRARGAGHELNLSLDESPSLTCSLREQHSLGFPPPAPAAVQPTGVAVTA
ncbi:unnamed protein product, partial [Prorocentrum cordatum]